MCFLVYSKRGTTQLAISRKGFLSDVAHSPMPIKVFKILKILVGGASFQSIDSVGRVPKNKK